MSNTMRIVIVAALAFAVGAVVASKQRRPAAPPETPVEQPVTASGPSAATSPATLPRLVDLGAGKCVPCKMMMPILAELKAEYAGRMQVEFIDVWEKPDAGRPYGVSAIPTQIFYDATGKELYRHEGFISKADILAKWKELGVMLGS